MGEVVSAYSQTNIQLFKQLQANGYSTADLASVGSGYRLAMELFAGQFRPSGKIFIEHLVGTASILSSIHANIDLVSAGLLHAAYDRGDFGGFPPSLTRKRQQVRDAIGARAEEYVFRYSEVEWEDATIRGLRNRLDKLDPIECEVVLMRLVNRLEDCLDLGDIYCHDSDRRKAHLEACGGLMVEMTRRLGYPELADEMEFTFRKVVADDPPSELLNLTRYGQQSFVMAPKSYSRRTSTTIRHFLINGLSRTSVGASFARQLRTLADGVPRKATTKMAQRHE